MSNAVTIKSKDSEFKENAMRALETKLYTGEQVVWTGVPNSTLYLIDLTYKALIWWSIFAFIVPMAPGGGIIELTALMVLMLTWLEFKKQWNSRVYFITDTRVIYAQKTRKGEWVFTHYPRSEFRSAKRAPLVKSLVMRFKTIHGEKVLKFPYLSDASEALALLQSGAMTDITTAVSS